MLTSPRWTLTWSTRTFLGTAPLALLTLLAWAFRWLPNEARPQLVLMVYLLLLLVCVGAACVAMLAACHLAIHNAFGAGFVTGQTAVERVPAQRRRSTDPQLRMVE